jgi:hypothetical protein
VALARRGDIFLPPETGPGWTRARGRAAADRAGERAGDTIFYFGGVAGRRVTVLPSGGVGDILAQSTEGSGLALPAAWSRCVAG